MDNEYPTFRRQLDTILQQRNPQALRDFLIETGQWDEDATMDPEVAMWMMIAASPAQSKMHAEADRWLRTHGRTDDIDDIASRRRAKSTPSQPRKLATPKPPRPSQA